MKEKPGISYGDDDDDVWNDTVCGQSQVPRSKWPPEQIAQAMRGGIRPPDRAFDRLLPRELRDVSWQHWTPLRVAMRAALWFDAMGVQTVVDIGSGPGKFCVAAALAGTCEYTGIEQRPRLISAATELAQRFALQDRVRFVQGALGEVQLPAADAYYLYNPFGENLFGSHEHLDEEVELGHARFARDVAAIQTLLRQAPVGTYVLTYNGFGGRVPASYREVLIDSELPNVLRLCRKVRRNEVDHAPERQGGYGETTQLAAAASGDAE